MSRVHYEPYTTAKQQTSTATTINDRLNMNSYTSILISQTPTLTVKRSNREPAMPSHPADDIDSIDCVTDDTSLHCAIIHITDDRQIL